MTRGLLSIIDYVGGWVDRQTDRYVAWSLLGGLFHFRRLVKCDITWKIIDNVVYHLIIFWLSMTDCVTPYMYMIERLLSKIDYDI